MNNEPVAWIAIGDNTSVFFDLDCALAIDDNPTPLYTHPSEHDLGIAEAIGFDKGYKAATTQFNTQLHPAKTLTDEEIIQINQDEGTCWDVPDRFAIQIARAILRKAQEK
jgi:hypothetical protein